MKKIMIVDVTRMDHNNCCIAGVCREEGDKLYRLNSPHITQAEARCGCFETGRVFTGEFTRMPYASAPHVEDCNWRIVSTGGLGVDADMKAYLQNSCMSDLDVGLGVTKKGTDTVDYVARGRSITTIKPISASLWIDKPFSAEERSKLKMHLLVGGHDFRYITVNDFRFYNNDGTIDSEMVARAQMCLARWRSGGLDLYVRTGLTRSYQGKYWLQVDGLHFFKRDTGEYCHRFLTSKSDFQNVA